MAEVNGDLSAYRGQNEISIHGMQKSQLRYVDQGRTTGKTNQNPNENELHDTRMLQDSSDGVGGIFQPDQHIFGAYLLSLS